MVTPSGMLRLVMVVQPWKERAGIIPRVEGNLICARDVHIVKEDWPIEVNPSGREISLRAEQCPNAEFPIDPTLPNETVSKLVHPKKLFASIAVSPSGRIIEVRLVQSCIKRSPVASRLVGS